MARLQQKSSALRGLHDKVLKWEGSDILWSILASKKILDKVVKVTVKENGQEIKRNINWKYLHNKIYIEENLMEKT